MIHIRTTNPIESAFDAVRLGINKSRNYRSRDSPLTMVFKLMKSAQKRWIRIRGFNQLTLVVNNVKFEDVIQSILKSRHEDRLMSYTIFGSNSFDHGNTF